MGRRRWTGPRPGNVGVGSGPPRELEDGGQKRKEVSLYIGAPPPTPQSAGLVECLLLIGGLPWWLTDAELRRHAEQFGQVRCTRILELLRSGKSTGIALLEYVALESAQRAARQQDGLASLPVWRTMGSSSLRVLTVSSELFHLLRSGALPWPD